jgi:polyferredoxin
VTALGTAEITDRKKGYDSFSDVLRWPVIGRFLRWRHARTAFQLFSLVVAAVVVLHGLLGPQIASNNLATVLTWVHYRGLLIVALLAAGNLSCTGCPFVLVRDAGRRILPPSWHWPRRLRTKWIGIALFIAVLFTYELFDLWALPRATSFLVLGYFGAALLIDVVFSGATFCKYLCPIGQFNFVASTMSPLELRVRDESTCRTCRTADCIKGRPAIDATVNAEAAEIAEQRITPKGFLRALRAPRSNVASSRGPFRSAVRPAIVQRGCELGLFLPMKVGNMDCTFCLDCVHACPHDNIALATRLPGAELAESRRRSGIGRLARRWDIAALAIVFVFGGMLNAFAMVAPVYRLEAWLAHALGVMSETPVLAIVFLASLVLVPVVLIGGAAYVTRMFAGGTGPIGRIAVNYVYALVPFGFGMWLAHYGFHLLTGFLTVIPIAQSAAIDALGWPALGGPQWRLAGMRPGEVFPIQLGFILLGAMGSLAVAYRISDREYPDHPGAPTAPWAIVTLTLTTAAIWILSQPMDMRGIGFLG